jgi:uncharacterized protein YndB with AHSA1/START domain
MKTSSQRPPRNLFCLAVIMAAGLGAVPWVDGDDSAAAPPQAPVAVQRILTPAKKLQFDVDVPAPVGDVWAAFATAEGMKTWIAPDARVDLRAGGDWLALFPGASAGGGKIVSFAAMSEIVIHALAPDRFPEVRSTGTTATFTLAVCGEKCTHVRLVQTGWLAGKQWDDAFDYLTKGNAQLLEQLRTRFVKGPIDWKGMGIGTAPSKQQRPEPVGVGAR